MGFAANVEEAKDGEMSLLPLRPCCVRTDVAGRQNRTLNAVGKSFLYDVNNAVQELSGSDRYGELLTGESTRSSPQRIHLEFAISSETH